MPVNHFRQSIASTLCGTHRDGKMAWQAEQQRTVNSAGHTITDGRKKKQRAGHYCFGRCPVDEQYLEKYKGMTFSPHFPSLYKGWRTAEPGSEHVIVINPMVRL